MQTQEFAEYQFYKAIMTIQKKNKTKFFECCVHALPCSVQAAWSEAFIVHKIKE